MNTVSRGVRNAFRNSVRTFSVVVILGLSIGLALAMLIARQAVGDKISSVKSSIGNTITVAPAGSQGFQGGGEPLTTTQLSKVSTLPNITKVTETLSDRLTTDNTNLVSAIEPGSLGRRGAANSGVDFTPPAGGFGRSQSDGDTQQITRTFTPPVIITGTNDTTSSSAYGGNSVKFTSGTAIDASKDEDKAMLGKALAAKNNVSVGSTFTAYGKTITVVGIYATGNTFSDAGLIMSLLALQRLSGQAGSVTAATIMVNSIDNLDSTVSAIKKTLGSAADVTSSQDSAKQTVEQLESVRTVSVFSLVGAVAAGAVIILLTMIMIVRERRREIGILKAIGASNSKVMLQFISEAVTLTVLGLIAGLIIGSVAANPITKILVNNGTSSSQTVQLPGQQPGAGGFGQRPRTAGGGSGLRSFGNNTLASARNIQAAVGWGILGYGIGTALMIAIIGSALPALLISKIRPAEVMRVE